MKNKLSLIAFIVLFLITVLTYVIVENPQTIGAQSLYLSITILSVFAGIYAVRNYGIDHGIGKSLAYLTAGLFSWSFAEIIWYSFNFFFEIDPYPSIADFFFLIAYPLFFIGIHFARKSAGVKFKSLPNHIKYSIIVSFIALTIATAYYCVYYVYDTTADTVSNIFSITYIIADLILLEASVLITVVVREFKKGKLGTFWALIFSGFVFFFIADILFGAYESLYTIGTRPYVYIDLFWVLGYMVIAYAYVDNALFMKSIRDRIKAGL